MPNCKTGFSLTLHRALGRAADAITFINALQHSHAMQPEHIADNLEAARQALAGAQRHLDDYAGTDPQGRILPFKR